MVGTWLEIDESLQAFNRSEHAVDAAISFRLGHGWILRVTRHSYFVLLRDGDHALDEIVDPLPELIGAHDPRVCELVTFGQLFVVERRICRATSARRRVGPDHAENRQVVRQSPKPGAGCGANLLADVVDLAVSLRALPHHHALDPRACDGCWMKQPKRVRLDPKRLDVLALARQPVDRPVVGPLLNLFRTPGIC